MKAKHRSSVRDSIKGDKLHLWPWWTLAVSLPATNYGGSSYGEFVIVIPQRKITAHDWSKSHHMTFSHTNCCLRTVALALLTGLH